MDVNEDIEMLIEDREKCKWGHSVVKRGQRERCEWGYWNVNRGQRKI